MPYPNINAERSRMGLTIEELAEKLGVTRKTVYNWMARGNIPQSKLEAMSSLSIVLLTICSRKILKPPPVPCFGLPRG